MEYLKYIYNRRSGGPTLGDLLPYAWWDALESSSISTYVDSMLTRVSQINDLSGNGKHLVKHASYSGPQTFRNDEEYQINGKNSLAFRNDYLSVNFGETLEQPFTIVLAMEVASATATTNTFFDGLSLATRARVMQTGSSGGYELRMDAGANFDSSFTVSDGSKVVLQATFNGASSRIVVNGSEETGNSGTKDLTGFILGARYTLPYWAEANIGECAIFDRELDSTDRAAVNSILNTKWSIY